MVGGDVVRRGAGASAFNHNHNTATYTSSNNIYLNEKLASIFRASASAASNTDLSSAKEFISKSIA